MEERELKEVFYRIFDDLDALIKEIVKGFLTENQSVLKESRKKFYDVIKSKIDRAEEIIGKKEKDETDMAFIGLMISFQSMIIAMENLIKKLEKKIESRTLFSERATIEIKDLLELLEGQLRDTRDYILTGNKLLKDTTIKTGERIFELANEYEMIHQNRLVTGICMPKASYFYIDITDSIKRIARGLSEFAEKV